MKQKSSKSSMEIGRKESKLMKSRYKWYRDNCQYFGLTPRSYKEWLNDR